MYEESKVMRFNKLSRILSPSLKEKNASLLVRAGYIKQLASGLYIYLPLALKVLNIILKRKLQGF